MYALGIDLGSSSIKVTVFDVAKGKSIGASFYPTQEMAIDSPQPGWAEQAPELWWEYFLKAAQGAFQQAQVSPSVISCIGIAYQMHGLVLVDKAQKTIRPSIIWCDSRAVSIGNLAAEQLGNAYCQDHLLNTPGNFTASKLRWVKEQEPENFEKAHKFMLPGDYIAFRLSGTITTTASGLSEGIFWNYKEGNVDKRLMHYYDFEEALVPEIAPTFGEQAVLSEVAAQALGMKKGTPISYRAGDQPNNAFSLNVLHPGEVAATAGTSGVIYAIADENVCDTASRINTFLHVNDAPDRKRNGLLLCVNGTGRLNSWIRSTIGQENVSYDQMNEEAAKVPIGADGLSFYPFGNGAERLLQNKDIGAELQGLQFNRHQRGHLYRAAQEGIVFALKYGFEVLGGLGVSGKNIRAGKANMFLSPLFREAFSTTVGAQLELYTTDGAEGAARGAALGIGLYNSTEEAFETLQCLATIEPDATKAQHYEEAYQAWKSGLAQRLSTL